MNKDNILYGVIGLLIGVIIGFFITNSINRSAAVNAPTASAPVAGGAGALPPNHPPVEGAASAGGGGDVTAMIEKAKNEPTNFEAQMQAGSMFYQIKRYPQALEFYEKAYKIKPDDFTVLKSLGDVTFDTQRYQEAERWYQMALKVRPNDADVRTDLGLSYYFREPRELDKAIAAYRASLSYDPRHEKTLQNLTAALIEKGDKAAARETLKQLAQVNPNNPALAQFQQQLGAP